MDDQDPKNHLYDMIEQVKLFYETPVVFLTKKDFSDIVFNTMCVKYKYMIGDTENYSKFIINHITEYHLEWLKAVKDIEKFKFELGANRISRDEIFDATNYTIDAMNKRLKYLRIFLNKHSESFSNTDLLHLRYNIEIVEGMHAHVVSNLSDTLKYFKNYADSEEFKQKVILKADELLTWLDTIFDRLSVDIGRYMNINLSANIIEMTNILQHTVERLRNSSSETAQNLIANLKLKGEQVSSLVRYVCSRNLEQHVIWEICNKLENRITELMNDDSKPTAELKELRKQRKYLEDKLKLIDGLKTTIETLHGNSQYNFDDELSHADICQCRDFFQLRIFNHSLPDDYREQLITQLSYKWDLALLGVKTPVSIISLLSSPLTKECFTDNIGTFTVDDNGRKIYKLPDDPISYQTNEHNELVPLSDDKEHIYFYDDCGRYYVNFKTRQRIYKALGSTSEYVMGADRLMLKHKEERDGKTYFYDKWGRYYINSEGKQIYRNENSISEYENDGLSNLVRIRSQNDILVTCPEDVQVSADFKYLKCEVGAALRKCIAETIMHQPADPVQYLLSCLLKFRQNIEYREKMALELEELEAERDKIKEAERLAKEKAALEAALLAQGGSEASFDYNLVNYETLNLDPELAGNAPQLPASTPRSVAN